MRIENSVRNSAFGVIRTIVRLILNFAVRTVFIKVLGEELLGLDSLFASILQVMSLAELGFGSAIVYTMYKPIAENDTKKIASLLRIYKKIYTIVGIVILCIGLIITPFIQYLINGKPPAQINIHIIFLIFLFNTVAGYFFAYKRSLLYANQRNDIENKVATLVLIGLNIFQIVFLLTIKNYYLYISIIPLFTIIENIVISIIVNKMFGHIEKGERLSKEESKALKKNTIAMLGQRIGGVVVFSTDNILMSAFLGLAIVGIYNNYYLIISAVASFISIFIKAITASIGNSVTTETKEKNYKNFNDLSFLNFWILGFCAICFLVLFQPFITIWLGQGYLLDDNIVLAIIFSFIFTQSRNIVNAYRDTSGKFYNDRFRPIIEAIVNLVFSLLLLHYLGLLGIILGTIISTIAVSIPIEAFVVHKYYFEKPLIKYFLKYIIYMICIGLVGGITWYICSLFSSTSIPVFIAKLAVCIVVPNLLFALLSFWTPEFKYFLNLAKALLLKLFKPKKSKENK